jgi:two-component system, NtrC family, sensor kinase
VKRRRATSRKPAKIQQTVKAKRRAASKAAPNRRLRPSASSKDTEIARLTRELAEAREQQTATSALLSAVARSSTDVQIVLDSVCQRAAHLCEAYDASIWRPDGDRLVLVSHHGPITQVESVPLERGSVIGRSVLDRQTIHIADLQSRAGEFPVTGEYARRLGFRTGLYVPLIREGVAVGIIALRRTETRLFTERQVALLQTFADQAVIAIENTRLLNELRERTDDLTESLEQQTATSEVLRVISSSPGELEPVFEAMLENATRVCGSNFGTLYLREGEAFRAVSMHGATPDYLRSRLGQLVHPGPGTGLGRAVRTKQAVHVADVTAEPAYRERDPMRVAAADLGGVRTMLNVLCECDDPGLARGRGQDKARGRGQPRSGSRRCNAANFSHPAHARLHERRRHTRWQSGRHS